MEWFKRGSPFVAAFGLVLLLTCGAVAAASGDPSSYVVVQARKLLNISEPSSSRGTGGGGRSSYSTELIMGPDDCSKEDVSVSQQNAPPLPNGIPTYSVDIINTCEECKLSDIHIACGEFASTELVDPAKFQRLAVNDCVVKGGAALEPSESVSFQYSNSFPYPLTVVSVSCA